MTLNLRKMPSNPATQVLKRSRKWPKIWEYQKACFIGGGNATPRSGYYEWKKSREERKRRVHQSDEIIRKIFTESKRTYGAERICGELRKQGRTASFKKIRERMKMMGLNSIHMRRKQRSLTDSSNARGEGYANLVKDFEITCPVE